MFRISTRAIQLAWLGVTLALVGLALASVATAVQTVLADASLDTAPQASPPSPPLPTQYPGETYAALRSSPVFGTLSPGPRTAPPVPVPLPVVESLPKSTLKLRLVGTVSGGPGEGFAIIENQTARTQKLYDVGDKVIEGAVLQAVYVQRVVLIRNGRREVLEMLPGAEAAPPGATGATRVPPRTGSRRSGSEPGALGPGVRGPIRRINDNLRVIDGARFQREMGEDLLQTVRTVYTAPRMVGGQPSGLILQDLGRGATLTELGFQVGDVVIAINGQRVNGPQDLAALTETMGTASDIRVQIIRNNLPRHLIYKVR